MYESVVRWSLFTINDTVIGTIVDTRTGVWVRPSQRLQFSTVALVKTPTKVVWQVVDCLNKYLYMDNQPRVATIDKTWDIFNDLVVTAKYRAHTTQWSVMDDWVDEYRLLRSKCESDLIRLLQQWDEKLSNLGNDPTHTDWDTFRPLRLSREEDWSDWLAYLFETSTSGIPAAQLFGMSSEAIAPHTIEREKVVGNYRADLVLGWPGNQFTHIEVKIGDKNFRKTHQTAQLLRNEYISTATAWQDIILLPSEDVTLWEKESEQGISSEAIKVLTWDEICVVLRRAMLKESVEWSTFARAFVGAVEQKIVGCHYLMPKSMSLSMLNRKITILEQSINYE